MNREVTLNRVPRRIISLVPSQTEFLYDLGLEKELVGITKFCVHPKSLFNSCPRIGGTKQLDLEKIKALKPDLIVGNKEENTREQIEDLSKEFPVWMSDVNTLEDAFAMMTDLSDLCGKGTPGNTLIKSCRESMSACEGLFSGQSALYLMWYNPWMAVGANTFINAMLIHLGFKNVIGSQERYPIVTEQELTDLRANFCLLSSEPFPFTNKHSLELQNLCKGANTVLVDGEMFSWYGSRLKLAGEYFQELSQKLKV